MSSSDIEFTSILRPTTPSKEASKDRIDDPQSAEQSVRVSQEVMRRLEVDETLSVSGVRTGAYQFVKRAVDSLVAAVVLAVLSPLLLSLVVVLRFAKQRAVLQRAERVGRGGRNFSEYSFNTTNRIFSRLPVLMNILRGEMAFVGPRPFSPNEMQDLIAAEPLAEYRLAVRPGIICDWWIRRHVSLDYVRELSLDLGYVQSCSLVTDMSIAFRALPGLITFVLWGDDPTEYDPVIDISGVRINNITMESAIEQIVGMMDEQGVNHACFINPHSINEAVKNREYSTTLRDADLVLADGFGTKLAGKILGRPVCQNLCGTDLFPRLCAALSGTGKGIYLLGAQPGLVDRVSDWLSQHYPDLVVKGHAHGYFTPEEEPDVVKKIADSGADLLVVGMGVPKQDVWIHQHLDALNVGVAMGFGGLFDYFAGRIPRAPKWMREMGMEWVYRLIQEPQRLWRRYLIGNGVFLARVMREKINPGAYPHVK